MRRRSRSHLAGCSVTVFRRIGLAGALFLFALLASCRGGHYYAGVTVGPPRPVVEGPIGVAPGVGYVWTPGFYDWDGSRWAWRHGEWRRPPHPGQEWVAPRWEHDHNGYRFHGGRWHRGGHEHH
jgi:hypothetical protein